MEEITDITVVVPSRGRPANVPVLAHIFPDAVWVVPKSQAIYYRDNGANIHPHDDDIQGSAFKYQYVLDNFEGPIFMVDDDVEKLWINVGRRGREVRDPDAIKRVILNAANCAQDIGTPIFGFSQAWDVRKFRSNEPFGITGWVGSAWGFLDRSIRFDSNIMLHCDVSYCMQVLLKNRVIWRDNRFAFVCERLDNVGGNSLFRTQGRDVKERNYLLEKWGGFISFTLGKSREMIKLNVARRQSLQF